MAGLTPRPPLPHAERGWIAACAAMTVLAPLWSSRCGGGWAQHVAPLRRWRRGDGAQGAMSLQWPPGAAREWDLLLPGVYAEVAVGEGEVHAHATGVMGGMERNA